MLEHALCTSGRTTFLDLCKQDRLDPAPIHALRTQRLDAKALQKWQPLADAVAAFLDHPKTQLLQRPLPQDTKDGVVAFGNVSQLDAHQHSLLSRVLQEFMPWKKGPFNFFGTAIDSEWRSDWKWQRLAPHLNLKGQRVADIGCNNGYYMWNALTHDPEIVIGFEPTLKHLLAIAFCEALIPSPRLLAEPLGVEHLGLYPSFFDTQLLLGILYHHTDPVGLLRQARQALRPGGQLIVDCQGIGGGEDRALMPRGRYAGASGIWWLPTLAVLQTWLNRSGFRNIEVIFAAPLSTAEQRSTLWAPIASLAEHLSPDLQATAEGYPPPWRFYVKALR